MSKTPNAEQILITKMVVASGGDYNDVQDEIQKLVNDPAHKLVIEAMDEYAAQVLSEYKDKLKRKLTDFSSDKHGRIFATEVSTLIDRI